MPGEATPPSSVDSPLRAVARTAERGSMRAVSRQTLGDQVYEQVREAIMRGDIPGGTEINQVELAKTLGVSRVPVREALRRLQAERLLDSNPFQRFVVTKLTRAQVIELYDLRQELEIFATLRARARKGFLEVDLPAVRRMAGDLDLDMPADDWLKADMEFHHALHGRGSAVSAIIDEVRFRIYGYLHLAEPDIARRKEVLAEHTAILDALEHGDEDEIRAVIRTHVRHTRDRLVRLAWADGPREAAER